MCGREATIRIAVANAEDAEWCARLMAESEPWITLGSDLENRRAAVRRLGTELFVASKDGTRMGFVLVAEYGMAGAPYIASIGVAEGARGQGIGAALLRFAEERFAGRRHVFLLVSSFNARAQKFYQEHGYARVGEIQDYIVPGKSELIYHKRLR
jgi:ribosomal protein S18 acetylase RimI-like enzyme